MEKVARHRPKSLVILEKTGRFVFHGSPRRLKKLKPNQQMNYDYKKRQLVPDGRPAVCATPFADIAIFRALVREGWTSFGTKNGKVIFGASSQTLHIARRAKGYVYIFRKRGFYKHSPTEMRTFLYLTPLMSIAVTFNDFSHRVQEIKNRKEYLAYIAGKGLEKRRHVVPPVNESSNRF